MWRLFIVVEEEHIEGEGEWKFPPDLPKWSRHSKTIKERYVNSFEFEVSGKKLVIKQANVIQAEDLVRNCLIWIN